MKLLLSEAERNSCYNFLRFFILISKKKMGDLGYLGLVSLTSEELCLCLGL